MYQIVCPDQITVDAQGAVSCPGGWVVMEYSPLFPPITIEDAWSLGSAIVACWAIAFALRIVRQQMVR